MKKIYSIGIAMSILISSALFATSCKQDPAADPDPTPLDTPSGFTVAASTASSLTIDWTAVTDAATYSIELSDGSQTLPLSSTEATYTFTSLNYETDYKVRVKALAAEGSKRLDSEFSEWFDAKTADGEIARGFASGDGTEDNPYIIEKASQLALLAQVVNEKREGFCERDVYYELGNDIDLSDYPDWTPIGNGADAQVKTVEGGMPVFSTSFNSHFNGGNYTVRNLKINATSGKREQFLGLFGINTCYIDFLKVEGEITVTSAYNGSEGDGYIFVGGIAGVIGNVDDEVTGVTVAGHFNNCSFKGSIVASSPADPKASICVGGICGIADGGSIDNCSVTIEAGKKLQATGGGLVGAAGICGDMSAGRVSLCSATINGDITAQHTEDPVSDRSTSVGGILGSVFKNAEVSQCNATISGTLTSSSKGNCNAYAGGIAGSLYANTVSGNNAIITGTLNCTSELGKALAGGVGGSAQANIGACSADLSGTVNVSVTDTAASNTRSATFGGVVGTSESTATLSWASIKGNVTMSAAGAALVEFGGVGGNTKTLSGCHALLDANIVLTSNTSPIFCGGVAGVSSNSNHLGCYSIVKGTFSMTSNMTGANNSCFGGITGANKVPVTGSVYYGPRACYTLLNVTVNTSGSGTFGAGTIAGNLGSRGRVTNSFYWNSNIGQTFSAVNGTAFASNDQAGYTEVLADMNQTLEDYGSYYIYEYSSAKGYLVLVPAPAEEE